MTEKKESEIGVDKIVSGSMDGCKVWVCDYRQPDLNKKPIRKVLPQEVLVRSNSETSKKIYYSKSHFAPLGKSGSVTKKVIPVFDNTGFRSRTGTPIRVFKTEYDCKVAFSDMCVGCLNDNDRWFAERKKIYSARAKELRKMSTDSLISLNKD